MDDAARKTFVDAVQGQIALLLKGKPLEAFDAYYQPYVKMFANDVLFASSAAEGRRKQEPFITAAMSIFGEVTDLNIADRRQVCVFRNRTRFTTADNTEHQINGLCWQRWENSVIVDERYYDGENLQKMMAKGILADPTILS